LIFKPLTTTKGTEDIFAGVRGDGDGGRQGHTPASRERQAGQGAFFQKKKVLISSDTFQPT
jgi:hypothetical protein